MPAKTENITIEQGKTYTHVVRWGDPEFSYSAITAITQAAPVAITTGAAHNIPDGWDVAVVSVKGMTQINASEPPKDREYVPATKVDGTSITINSINAASYKAYTSGGYLQFRTPHSLAAVTARMAIKDKVGGTVLATSEGLTPTITIAIDDTFKTITITMSATDTAEITWERGVYELEAVEGSVVYSLMAGTVTVTQEIVT